LIDVVIDLHEKCSSQANGPVGMRNVYFDGKSNIEIAHHDDTHQMFPRNPAILEIIVS